METTGAENVRWDLSRHFYSGIDDPQLDADIREWCALAKQFYVEHRGMLTVSLGNSIADMIALKELESKIGKYLDLMSRIDTGVSAVQARSADIKNTMNATSAD